MPCSASARPQLGLDAPSQSVEVGDDAPADRVDRLERGAPVGQRVGQAGVDLIVQPGDADHEELVEVRREDRANFTRSSSGIPSSTASCRTRSLKSIHDNSRLKYSSGVSRSDGGSAAGGAAGISRIGSWLRALVCSVVLMTRPLTVERRRCRDVNAMFPGSDARPRRIRDVRANPLRSSERHSSRNRSNSSARRARRCVASDLQPAPSIRGQRRRGECGVEVVGVAGRAARVQRRQLAPALDQREHARQRDVAVVDLAKQVLELAALASRRWLRSRRSSSPRSARGCSAAAWRRCACRAAHRPARGPEPSERTTAARPGARPRSARRCRRALRRDRAA